MIFGCLTGLCSLKFFLLAFVVELYGLSATSLENSRTLPFATVISGICLCHGVSSELLLTWYFKRV